VEETWKTAMSEKSNEEVECASSQCANRLAWFLVGVVVGASAAILYAPKSGKDTRRYLSRRTQESREAVEATSRDIVDRGREFFEKGRELVDDAADLFDRGRKLVRG
jgi:gas vesicle protein